MDRSLYPEGVEVHQRHLENTESTKIGALKQGAVDTTSRGVASGLAVTINGGDATKFDIALGYGYTPNGDFLRLVASQTAVALADNTLGVQNYVILMYDEQPSSPEAHETDGTTRNTRTTNSPRVVVLTAAQYAALPGTDAVLSNNAKDRALLVAIITATGGAITTNAIAPPTIFRNVLQSNQPTNITGVVIIGVDTNTPAGTGTLTFLSGPKTITWQAPGEGSPGAITTFTTSGVYIITSSGGRVLQVNVLFSLLPVTNQSDSITITNIYTQLVPRYTAIDAHHRTYLGTGVPTPQNPHGLTLDDLSPGAQGTLEEHQDVMHSNGILRISSPGLLVGVVSTIPAPDTATFTNFAAGDTCYINGKRIQTLAASNVITFTDGIPEPSTYAVYLGQDRNLYKTLLARFPTIASSLLYAKVQILNVVGMTPGTHNLTWTTAGNLQLNSGPLIAAPTAAPDHAIRVYNTNRQGYMDLFVKGSAAPGSNETDVITVLAQPDPEENMPVATLVWAGSSIGFVGYGFGVSNAPNLVFDTRIFGTLAEVDTRFDEGIINTSLLANEILGDGIMVRSRLQSGSSGTNEVSVLTAFTDQFFLGTLSFPNITLNGGVIYVGGHRWEIPTTTLVMSNNITNRIYVDGFGALQTSTLSWAAIEASETSFKHRPFQRLYDLTVTASAESGRVDLREYVGQKRNPAMGVIALDQNRRANIADAGGPAGQGFKFLASGPNNTDCVQGTGFGTGAGVRGEGGASGAGVVGVAIGTDVAGVAGGNLAGTGTGVSGSGSLFSFLLGTPPQGTGVAGLASIIAPAPGGYFIGSGALGHGCVGIAADLGAAGVTGLSNGATAPVGTGRWGVYGKGADYGVVGNGVSTSPGGFFSSISGSIAVQIPNNQYYSHLTSVSKSIIMSGSAFVPNSPAAHWDRAASGGNGFGIAWRSHNTQTISLEANINVPALATVTGLQVLAAQNNPFSDETIGVYFCKNVYNPSGFPTLTSIGSGGTGAPTNHTIPLGGNTAVPQWFGPAVGYSYSAVQMPAAVVGVSEGHLNLNIILPATSAGLGSLWFYGARITYTLIEFDAAL